MSSKLAQAIVSGGKKKDITQREQDAERYSSMDTDDEIQKRWKDYNKIIGPESERWSREDWYDLNYPDYKTKSPKGLMGYATRSKRISETMKGY